MINLQVFQYSREIELVCLDRNTSSTYLGNMPMYDGHHKLHKGIDNTLRFKIRDTDRKPVDLTDKELVFRLYDRKSRENILNLSPTVVNASKGLASLVISGHSIHRLLEGFYSFSMHTISDGVEQIIYTDTYDNAVGVFEVVDDVYPQFMESQEAGPSMLDGIKYVSSIFDGATDTILSKSSHTFALYFSDFTGTFAIQGCMEVQPSITDHDWFNIRPINEETSEIIRTDANGPEMFVVQSNVRWLRVIHYPTSGTISRILLRN